MKSKFTSKNWLGIVALVGLLLFGVTSNAQVTAKCAGFTAAITNGTVLNLCPGSSITLNASPSTAGYNFEWQVQTSTGGPFTSISGASGANYTTSSLGAYRVIINTGSCKDTSGITSVLRINPQGGTITSANPNGVCPNEPGGLLKGDTVGGVKLGLITHTWEKMEDGVNWVVISGATNIDFLVSSLTKTTKFRRVSNDNCGNKAYSNEVTITILGVSSGGTIGPKTQTVTRAQTPAPINSITPASGGGTISYQWQRSDYQKGPYMDITGATGANYAPPRLDQNTYFRRVAKENRCNSTASSDTALVIVSDAILDAGYFTVNSGCVFPGKAAAVLETRDPASGGTPPYVQQWQQSPDNITWTDIPNANSNTYQPMNLTQSTYFRKKVTDAAGAVDYSNVALITLVTSVLNGGTISPTATVACLGSNPAIIKNTGSPTGYAERLSFQWQYKSASTGGNWVDIAGQIRENLIPDPINEKTSFRRVAMDACGPNTRTAPSNEVEIDIRPALNPGDISPTSQVIRPGNTPLQLTNVNAPSGGTGSYTINWDSASAAVGPFSRANLQNGSLNYQPSALTNSAYYRRVVTDNNCLAVKYTYVVEVYVNLAPPVNGGTLKGSACVFPGNLPAVIESNVPASGGTPPYSYIWESKPITSTTWTVIAGETNETLQPAAITQTTQYRRLATDVYGESAYSDVFTIEYHTAALVAGTIAPTGLTTLCNGAMPGLIRSVTPMSGYGENPMYQWQIKLGSGSWTDIAGANDSTYQPGAITQVTSFRRVASDMCGGVSRFANSNEVQFRIGQAQKLLAGLVDGPFITCTGTAPGQINSVLDACGASPRTYQWQVKSGTSWQNISGATLNTYSPVAMTKNQTFRRTVTDGCGSTATSNEVDIFVYPAIEPGIIGLDTQYVCPNQTPSLLQLLTDCHYTDGTVTYQWQIQTAGGGWSNVNGATTSSYQPPKVTSNKTYRLKVSSTTCSAVKFTNTATIIVNNACRQAERFAPATTTESADTKVYPNPMTGNTIHVQLGTSGKASVRMVNAEGTAVPVSITQSGLNQVKVSFNNTPAKGMYLLTVQEGKTSWTKKVIVQ